MKAFNDIRIYPQNILNTQLQPDRVEIDTADYQWWSIRFAYKLVEAKVQVTGWPIIYLYLNPTLTHGSLQAVKNTSCQEFYLGFNAVKYMTLDCEAKDNYFIEGLYGALRLACDGGLITDRDSVEASYAAINQFKDNTLYAHISKTSGSKLAVGFYTIGAPSKIYIALRTKIDLPFRIVKLLEVEDHELIFKLLTKISISTDWVSVQSRPSLSQDVFQEISLQLSPPVQLASKNVFKIPINHFSENSLVNDSFLNQLAGLMTFDSKESK